MKQANTILSYREFHSADEAERWGETYYKDLYGKNCEDNADFEQLFLYSGSGYRLYNSQLRYNEEYDEIITQGIERLTDILARHTLPENVIAYRYTQKQILSLLCAGKPLRPGLRFSDKAFLSTSLVKASLSQFKKENPCDCLLKLYLPKGLHSIYISLKNTNSRLNEQELLLQRDTEFEIIRIHRLSYPLLIECKAT